MSDIERNESIENEEFLDEEVIFAEEAVSGQQSTASASAYEDNKKSELSRPFAFSIVALSCIVASYMLLYVGIIFSCFGIGAIIGIPMILLAFVVYAVALVFSILGLVGGIKAKRKPNEGKAKKILSIIFSAVSLYNSASVLISVVVAFLIVIFMVIYAVFIVLVAGGSSLMYF